MEDGEEKQEIHFGASETELFTTTANTLDKLREELKDGKVGRSAIRALLFISLDTEDNILLYQAGGLKDIVGLAQFAAQKAIDQAMEEGYNGE